MTARLGQGEAFKDAERQRAHTRALRNHRRNAAARANLVGESEMTAEQLREQQARLRADAQARHPEWFA